MIPNLPTFGNREKLTAGKLNQLRDAIESKFASITGVDLVWPLVCTGDIDFASLHSIVGLRSLWNIINAGDYALDSIGFQAAIDAAPAGGCVLIPPKTTIIAQGIDITQDDLLILGCGSTSILQLKSGATAGYLLQSSASALTDLSIMNLTLDGQSTGTAQKGVVMQYVKGLTMRDVIIKNFTGDALHLTSNVAGNSCTEVILDAIKFRGGGAGHLLVDDIDGGFFTNISCLDAATTPIVFAPSAAGAMNKNLHFRDVRVDGVTSGLGFQIEGDGAASPNWSNIILDGCQARDMTGDAFQVGASGLTVSDISITGCMAHASGGNAFTIESDGGIIANNYAHDVPASQDGINLEASSNVTVQGNTLHGDSAQYAIDGEGTTNCIIKNNIITGIWTEPIHKDSSTDLRVIDNFGDKGMGTHIFNSDADLLAPGGTPASVWSYTIPGNTLNKAGDGFRFWYNINSDGTATSGTGVLRVNGIGMATGSTKGPFGSFDCTVQGVIYLVDDASGNIESQYIAILQGAAGYNSDTTVQAIDMSVDQVLDIYLDGGDANQMQLVTISIEFFNGEVDA